MITSNTHTKRAFYELSRTYSRCCLGWFPIASECNKNLAYHYEDIMSIVRLYLL